MKLEWKIGEADCEFGHYTICMNREGSFDARFSSPQECMMIAINRATKVDAVEVCESHYLARIDRLALANGYIKLADDEVVVKRATAEAAFSWVMGFVRAGGMTKDDYTAKDDLTAALEREVGK